VAPLALASLLGTKSVENLTTLVVLVKANHKELGLFDTKSYFLLHLIDQNNRPCPINNLVLLSAAVASPAFLNIGTSLILGH
jgi:hypothetical protein